MKKIIILLTLYCIMLSAQSQDNTYLNYRVILPSYTNCFVNKGDLKIAYQRQNYTANMKDYDEPVPWLKTFAADVIMNFIADSENRFLLSYTLTDHFTLGVSYINLYRIGEFFKLEGTDIYYESIVNSYELSGSYHKSFTPSLEYELGTSLLFGSGYFLYEEWLSDAPESKLSFSTFNHKFSGAISYRFMKLRLGLMINTGYLIHFNTEPSSVRDFYYDNMVYNFDDHRTDFYIDPAFLVGIHTDRVGILGHIAYPYAFGESKISRPILMMGLGMSVKILRGNNE